MSSISELYVSYASIEGVDAQARLHMFYGLIFGVLVLVPVFYFFIDWIWKKAHLGQVHLIALATTSIFGLLAVIGDLYGMNNRLLLSLIQWLVLYQVISGLLHKRIRSSWRWLFHPAVYSKLILVSIVLTGVLFYMCNMAPFMRKDPVANFFIVFGGLQLLLTIIQVKTKIPWSSLLKKLSFLISVPIGMMIAVEFTFLQMANGSIHIDHRGVFVIVLLMSVGVNFVLKKRLRTWSSADCTRRLLVPAALGTVLVMIFYHPLVHQPAEMFELANPANANMRIFQFGEIPLVDFMSSHMLSEQYYGVLYFMIHGYDASLDFLVFKCLNLFLFYGVSYVVLARVLRSPLQAFFFLLTFPFIGSLFYLPLILTIPLITVLRKLTDHPHWKNYVLLAVLLLALTAWKLDAGIAAIGASALFLSIGFYIKRCRPDFKAIGKSVLAIAAIMAGCLLLLLVIRSWEHLSISIQSALHYIKASQAHAYPELAVEKEHQFYTLHYLLPVVSALFVLLITGQLRNRFDKLQSQDKLKLLALFLFLLHLVNFQRGLVRHTFIELSDIYLISTFVLGFTIWVLSLFDLAARLKRLALLSTVSVATILGLKFFPLHDYAPGNSFLAENSFFQIDTVFYESQLQGRVIGKEKYAKATYEELVEFLDRELREDETFVDFSNTPLLYYYAQRNVPSYFCQSQQNMVDDYLQLEQIRRLKETEVPFALYSNYPITWMDQTDGVPNALRQYLLAEYIYVNYQPFAVLDSWCVWKLKGRTAQIDDIKRDTIQQELTSHNYKKLAGVMYEYFTNGSGQEAVERLNTTDLRLEKEMYCQRLYLSEEIKSTHALFFGLTFENSALDEFITLHLEDTANNQLGHIYLERSREQKSYLVRISNFQTWQNGLVDHLRIDTYLDLKFEFFKDVRVEY